MSLVFLSQDTVYTCPKDWFRGSSERMWLEFFILLWRILGYCPQISRRILQQNFPTNFSTLFLQGFTPPNHSRNSRPKLSPSLQPLRSCRLLQNRFRAPPEIGEKYPKCRFWQAPELFSECSANFSLFPGPETYSVSGQWDRNPTPDIWTYFFHTDCLPTWETNLKLNAVAHRRERKWAQTQVHKRAQKCANERKRALPRKNCKQPGLKQPGLGTPKPRENMAAKIITKYLYTNTF